MNAVETIKMVIHQEIWKVPTIPLDEYVTTIWCLAEK